MYRFGDTDDNLCVEKIHIGQFSILIIKKKKKINRNEYEKSLRRVVISRGAKQFNVWTDFTSKEGKKKKKKEIGVREQVDPRLSFFTSLFVTIARVLDLPLSPSLSLVSPLVRPSSASSRSLLPLFRLAFSFPLSLYIALSSSHSHLCTSAFLTAERRSGFRRKETTIQKIVATDHSWRVDRINGVSYTNESSTGAYDTYI